MRRADVDVLLRRALERAGDAAGIALAVRSGTMTRWASATFAGARHELVLDLPGGGADWLAGLPEADLPLTGHLVADLKVVALSREAAALSATLEILTVEDR